MHSSSKSTKQLHAASITIGVCSSSAPGRCLLSGKFDNQRTHRKYRKRTGEYGSFIERSPKVRFALGNVCMDGRKMYSCTDAPKQDHVLTAGKALWNPESESNASQETLLARSVKLSSVKGQMRAGERRVSPACCRHSRDSFTINLAT